MTRTRLRIAALGPVAAAALVVLLCACGIPVRLIEPSLSIEEARQRVPFEVRVPACLPSSVGPTPRVRVEQHPPTLHLDYLNRGRKGGGPAVGITASWGSSGDLYTVGERLVLDGQTVVVSETGRSLEWIQNGTRYDLTTTLSPEDTLRIYHSMVTGSDSCDLPQRG